MTERSNPLGLYIHIPFCHARCGYCDFVTFTGKEDQRDAYVEALCKEMELYATIGCHPDESRGPGLDSGIRRNNGISTVFFGGGTPSVLEPAHIASIFASLRRHFSIDPDAEITLEANPESITAERLVAWQESGINRLSIGLQAYNDTLLKAMGRLHTVQQFDVAYRSIREAGFSNLNIDLIYGFPSQTLASWKQTLEAAVCHQPEHLSLYALTVEEHTPYGVSGVEVDEDLQAEMYAQARIYLPEQGYGQYEVSNFARQGKECLHNLIYWRGQDYLGLGVGAVGCVGGLRWENQKNLGPYHKDIASGRLPRLSQENLDEKTRKFERLMLGLRLREGLSWTAEEDPEWHVARSRLVVQGYLEEIQPGTWRIPDPYVPFTNQILLPFL